MNLQKHWDVFFRTYFLAKTTPKTPVIKNEQVRRPPFRPISERLHINEPTGHLHQNPALKQPIITQFKMTV